MKLFGKMKIYIRKYIRKYMVLALSLIMFPLLSVNSYAAYSTYPQYNCTIPFVFSFQVVNGSQYYSNMIKGDDTNYHLTQGQGWVNDSDVYISTFLSNTSETDDKFYFPINTNLFDYYLVTSISVDQVAEDFTISDFDLGNFVNYQPISFESSNILTDKKVYYSKYDIAQGSNGGIQSINCTAKLNLDYVGDLNLGVIYFKDVNGGLYDNTKFFTCSVIVANKGDTEAYSDIVTAINTQTDIIENGNSGTQSAINDFNQVFEDFNQELENIEEFDSQIIGEFESANEQYMTELNNFNLSASLLNAGNWLSTSMQTVYDNSSDYKMLWLVPLLFGIPILLFIIRKNGDDE